MKPILILPIILIATAALLRAEVDTGRPCGGTPYDSYMGPMRQTFARLGDGSPSVSDVRSQMRTAYRFRYYFDPAQPYTPQTPEVTESRQQGDCKAKSLWLAQQDGRRATRATSSARRQPARRSRTRGCSGRMAARGSSSIQPIRRRSSRPIASWAKSCSRNTPTAAAAPTLIQPTVNTSKD